MELKLAASSRRARRLKRGAKKVENSLKNGSKVKKKRKKDTGVRLVLRFLVPLCSPQTTSNHRIYAGPKKEPNNTFRVTFFTKAKVSNSCLFFYPLVRLSSKPCRRNTFVKPFLSSTHHRAFADLIPAQE